MGFRYGPFETEHAKSYQNRFSDPKRYDDPSPRFLYMGVPTRIYVPLIKLSQILHEHVYIAIKLKSAVKHFIKKSRHVIIKKAAEVKKKKKDRKEKMFPAEIEPATFRVLGGRDNHYTTETAVNVRRSIKNLFAKIHISYYTFWCVVLATFI